MSIEDGKLDWSFIKAKIKYVLMIAGAILLFEPGLALPLLGWIIDVVRELFWKFYWVIRLSGH